MSSNKKIIKMTLQNTGIFLILMLVFLFAGGNKTLAATLQLDIADIEYSEGEIFSTDVYVLPNGQDVNTIDTTLKFDPEYLSVVSLDTSNSAFTEWISEPTFSNTEGTVDIKVVSDEVIFDKASVTTITWKAESSGVGDVIFANTTIISDSSSDVNVYESSISNDFLLTTSRDSAISDEENATSTILMTLTKDGTTTSGYLNPNHWYNSRNIVFKWMVPETASAVAVLLATSSTAKPEFSDGTVYEASANEFKATDDVLFEGVQYLNLSFRDENGWGEVNSNRLLLDTVPPQDFEVKVESIDNTTKFPVLSFKSKDATSGIDYYEVSVEGYLLDKVKPEEVKAGYVLQEVPNGEHEVMVTAYDKAGNYTISKVPVLFSAGWVKSNSKQSRSGNYMNSFNTLSFLLLLVVILQFIYYRHQKTLAKTREEKLRQETLEIHEQMTKIFSALREEIFEQISKINKRKKLSKNEKEAVDSLTEAIEVSETLIEKEITDVKSMLK